MSGKVMLRGKPVTDGVVIFDPSNVNRKMAQTREAKIGKDGTYEVTTLVGDNTVSVGGPVLSRDPAVGYATQVVTVQEGANIHDIKLPLNTP